MDMDIAAWTMHVLGRQLPKPKQAPVAQPATTAMDNNQMIMSHAISLAQDVIRANTESKDREKESSKQIPEPILCKILGLSGLHWEDRDLMAGLWHEL